MKGYIGQDVMMASLDYGEPTNFVDLPDGSRAFQWVFNNQYQVPTTVNQTGTVSVYNQSAVLNNRTVISGGQLLTNTCAYTLLGRYDISRRAWIIYEFRQPRFLCN